MAGCEHREWQEEENMSKKILVTLILVIAATIMAVGGPQLGGACGSASTNEYPC